MQWLIQACRDSIPDRCDKGRHQYLIGLNGGWWLWMKLRLNQLEQSSIRDTHIVFSRYLQAQPFKIPAFSIPQLSFLYQGSFSFNWDFALNYHLFQTNCCPSPACALCDASIEDAKHYFLYCPSLLLCVKTLCLPPLHNYLEIDGIVPQIRKNRLAFKWYFYCWFSK